MRLMDFLCSPMHAEGWRTASAFKMNLSIWKRIVSIDNSALERFCRAEFIFLFVMKQKFVQSIKFYYRLKYFDKYGGKRDKKLSFKNFNKYLVD